MFRFLSIYHAAICVVLPTSLYTTTVSSRTVVVVTVQSPVARTVVFGPVRPYRNETGHTHDCGTEGQTRV